ncbi:MAG TPA: GntR family transcriptional regulator [Anaerolineae bacterium]|nr:GntR family transcriptional regulator [Anaerolineae bacterium]
MDTVVERVQLIRGGDMPRAGESLARRIHDRIWHDLVTWRFKPSDILVEDRLADEFGTSRTPVRESLKRLTEEGFLRVVPRTGYVVLPVTLGDVHEAIHLRLLLECEAAALAAMRLTDEVRKDLESWWTEFERALRAHGDELDATEVGIVILGLHVAIARASGSRRLADVIDAQVRQTTREMLHPGAIVSLEFVVRDHRVLLDAVLSGDPERARSTMARHFEAHRDRLLEAVISEPEKTHVGLGAATTRQR